MRFTTRQFIMNHPAYRDALTGLEIILCKSYHEYPFYCARQTIQWVSLKPTRKVAVIHG